MEKITILGAGGKMGARNYRQPSSEWLSSLSG